MKRNLVLAGNSAMFYTYLRRYRIDGETVYRVFEPRDVCKITKDTHTVTVLNNGSGVDARKYNRFLLVLEHLGIKPIHIHV